MPMETDIPSHSIQANTNYNKLVISDYYLTSYIPRSCESTTIWQLAIPLMEDT